MQTVFYATIKAASSSQGVEAALERALLLFVFMAASDSEKSRVVVYMVDVFEGVLDHLWLLVQLLVEARFLKHAAERVHFEDAVRHHLAFENVIYFWGVM